MIITVTGQQGEGKYILVNDLISKEEYLQTNQCYIKKDIRLLTDDHKFLVIDEVTYPLRPFIKALIDKGQIKIRRPYSRVVETVNVPHIILITNDKRLSNF